MLVLVLCRAVQALPLNKKFIRGVSYITGFLLRNSENGCTLNYVTQTDPKGMAQLLVYAVELPHFWDPAIFVL